MPEDLARLALGVGASENPPPWLAIPGGRLEHDLIRRPAWPRRIEADPPRSLAAAHGARLALRQQRRLLSGPGIRPPPRLDSLQPSAAGRQRYPELLRVSISRISKGQGDTRAIESGLRRGQSFGVLDEPVPAAARGQSGRLVGVGTRRSPRPARRDMPILLQRRLRRLPLVPRDGARVVRGRHVAAYLNEHFVSVKVDREERPDIDAVYMEATTALTGQGGWPMTCLLDAGRCAVLRRHVLPARPVRPAARGRLAAWAQRPRRGAGAPDSDVVGALAADAAAEHRRTGCRPRPARRRGRPRWPAVRPRRTAASAARRSSRRRWCWSSCCATTSAPATRAGAPHGRRRRSRRWPAAACTTSSPAGSRATRSTAAGWCRTSRRCSTTTRCCCACTCTGGALTGAPLAERIAGETADFLLRDLRTAEGGFASALDADTDGVEGLTYVWTPAQLARCSGTDGAAAARLFEVTEDGTFEHGASTLQLRADPDDAAQYDEIRAPAARRARDPAAAGPRRQGRHRVERAGDRRARRSRALLDAPGTARTRPPAAPNW